MQQGMLLKLQGMLRKVCCARVRSRHFWRGAWRRLHGAWRRAGVQGSPGASREETAGWSLLQAGSASRMVLAAGGPGKQDGPCCRRARQAGWSLLQAGPASRMVLSRGPGILAAPKAERFARRNALNAFQGGTLCALPGSRVPWAAARDQSGRDSKPVASVPDVGSVPDARDRGGGGTGGGLDFGVGGAADAGAGLAAGRGCGGGVAGRARGAG